MGGWKSSASGVESQMQLSECKGTTVGLVSILEMDLLKRRCHFSVWSGERTRKPRSLPGHSGDEGSPGWDFHGGCLETCPMMSKANPWL